MKKKIIILAIYIITLTLIIGCDKKEIEEEYSSYQSSQRIEKLSFEENDIPYIKDEYGDIDNLEILERYDNVNKKNLKYEFARDYSVEEKSDTITVIKSALDDLDPTSNKKYGDILLGYTYSQEVNPILATYDEAIEMIYKLLPDDIKEEKIIEDNELNKKYIYYTSSKDNFIVGLSYGGDINKNNVIGIHYLKEIK